MATHKKYRTKNRNRFPVILMSLALVSIVVIYQLWSMSLHIPDLTQYERARAVGTASIWVGYKMLNLMWVLLCSTIMILWQVLFAGMIFIKRFLSFIFYILGQILLLYSIYFPLILIISLFFFCASWFMRHLILEKKYGL